MITYIQNGACVLAKVCECETTKAVCATHAGEHHHMVKGSLLRLENSLTTVFEITSCKSTFYVQFLFT